MLDLHSQPPSDILPPPNPAGEVALLRAQLRRVTSENDALRYRVDELRRLVQAALHDELTGLPNRRYFDRRVREEIERARRQPDQPFSLLVVDVDDFKAINDTHGHATGDACLRWVGEFLVRHLRAQDVCCRMGGDEFLVILPHTGPRAAVGLCGRLVRRLAAANRTRPFPLGLSVGSATFGVHGREIEPLFEHADRAMYAEKRRQKSNRTLVASPGGQERGPATREARLQTVRRTREYHVVRSQQTSDATPAGCPPRAGSDL